MYIELISIKRDLNISPDYDITDRIRVAAGGLVTDNKEKRKHL
jgi:hypothetical protein